MRPEAMEFLVRLHDLAKECDIEIRLTDSNDVLMAPTYKPNGGLDEWFVIGINPYRHYKFFLETQETQRCN
jgi:hypothetical protein